MYVQLNKNWITGEDTKIYISKENRIEQKRSRDQSMRSISSRFKLFSRAVHEEQVSDDQKQKHIDIVGEINNNYPVVVTTTTTTDEVCTSSSSLTVWRKSLLINCKGFTVIDSYGNLVYRVDNYSLHPHELILMDASGNSLLTMRRRRRKLGLVENWYVYEGEMGKKKVISKTTTRTRTRTRSKESPPVCCVKKSVNYVNILNGNPKVQAYVYRVAASDSDNKRHAAFTIEGSYGNRTCKVLDECKRAVAEIKRKEANSKDASFGIDIFHLIVYPHFDPAFAMALVLLLDQMFT